MGTFTLVMPFDLLIVPTHGSEPSVVLLPLLPFLGLCFPLDLRRLMGLVTPRNRRQVFPHSGCDGRGVPLEGELCEVMLSSLYSSQAWLGDGFKRHRHQMEPPSPPAQKPLSPPGAASRGQADVLGVARLLGLGACLQGLRQRMKIQRRCRCEGLGRRLSLLLKPTDSGALTLKTHCEHR